MESTLPSLDIIRLNYMKDNPGYLFGFTDTGIECPLERNGLCDRNGIRYWKWINFITLNSTNAAKTVNMKVPNIITRTTNPDNHILVAEGNYNILRQHPVFSIIIQTWRLNRH